MSLNDFWRVLRCLLAGHDWRAYYYPRGDGWFGGPHWRRECTRCNKDEAMRTDR